MIASSRNQTTFNLKRIRIGMPRRMKRNGWSGLSGRIPRKHQSRHQRTVALLAKLMWAACNGHGDQAFARTVGTLGSVTLLEKMRSVSPDGCWEGSKTSRSGCIIVFRSGISIHEPHVAMGLGTPSFSDIDLNRDRIYIMADLGSLKIIVLRDLSY